MDAVLTWGIPLVQAALQVGAVAMWVSVRIARLETKLDDRDKLNDTVTHNITARIDRMQVRCDRRHLGTPTGEGPQ